MLFQRYVVVFVDMSGVIEELSGEERMEWETLSVRYEPYRTLEGVTLGDPTTQPLIHCHSYSGRPVSSYELNPLIMNKTLPPAVLV